MESRGEFMPHRFILTAITNSAVRPNTIATLVSRGSDAIAHMGYANDGAIVRARVEKIRPGSFEIIFLLDELARVSPTFHGLGLGLIGAAMLAAFNHAGDLRTGTPHSANQTRQRPKRASVAPEAERLARNARNDVPFKLALSDVLATSSEEPLITGLGASTHLRGTEAVLPSEWFRDAQTGLFLPAQAEVIREEMTFWKKHIRVREIANLVNGTLWKIAWQQDAIWQEAWVDAPTQVAQRGVVTANATIVADLNVHRFSTDGTTFSIAEAKLLRVWWN